MWKQLHIDKCKALFRQTLQVDNEGHRLQSASVCNFGVVVLFPLALKGEDQSDADEHTATWLGIASHQRCTW